MDLRIQKTKSAVKGAFLELRRRKPVEKITVTELSKLAEINKATFYLHYSDIYSLADEIEDEMIDSILSELHEYDKFFDDPKKYTSELLNAFIVNRHMLNTIFSGSRYSCFSNKVEKRVKARLYGEFPQLNTRHNDIILSFVIQGAFHTITAGISESTDADDEIEVLTRLTDSLFSNLERL